MLMNPLDVWLYLSYVFRRTVSDATRLWKKPQKSQKLDLGRTVPCALGDAGLYLVRVEGLASGVDAVLSWERGGYIRSGCGREVSRLVVHSDKDTQTLFSEPDLMMDVIVNAPFSIIPISGISLILLDLQTSSIEVVNFKDFVAWPPVHVPKVA